MKLDVSQYRLKLAETEEERLGAQRLRYRVFVEEMGATASPEKHAAQREWDAFDAHADHLILLQSVLTPDPLDRVVGVYRLMRRDAARTGAGFYGAKEFDLDPIERTDRDCVELGRSCVAPDHRGGPALHLLWTGLAEYVLERELEILFGVASFPGTDPAPLAEALSYLHRAHLAPPELRVRARNPITLPKLEAIDPLRAMRAIPPLIKAYLRLGGVIGEGAYVDREFNTVDVCLLMDTVAMTARYRALFQRSRSAPA